MYSNYVSHNMPNLSQVCYHRMLLNVCMLIYIIHEGSVPHPCSNNNFKVASSNGDSLPDFLFLVL